MGDWGCVVFSFLSNATLAMDRRASLGEGLVQEYSTSTGLTEGIRSAITLFQNCFLSSQSLDLLRAKKE